MGRAPSNTLRLLALALAAVALFGQSGTDIPEVWSEDALRAMTAPGAGSPAVHYPPAQWYYSIPEHPIYRVYPVYAPAKEPPDYMAFLSAQVPELAFDPAALKTDFRLGRRCSRVPGPSGF
jgi:hypothetical protein